MRPLSPAPFFWGPASPLRSLSALVLLILAGGRTAFALVIALALLWVYGFSVPLYFAAVRFVPPPFFPARRRILIPVVLSAFFSSLFLLLLWLLNPVLALELSFLICLTPICCAGSGIFTRGNLGSPLEVFIRALLEAAILGFLILALALIREPLGHASLSFPGGSRGIVEFLGGTEGEGFFPARIAASSAGGLLLMGYGLAIFRSLRARYGGEDDRP
jgi:hypothetical protein